MLLGVTGEDIQFAMVGGQSVIAGHCAERELFFLRRDRQTLDFPGLIPLLKRYSEYPQEAVTGGLLAEDFVSSTYQLRVLVLVPASTGDVFAAFICIRP